jgi:hypothetical protein
VSCYAFSISHLIVVCSISSRLPGNVTYVDGQTATSSRLAYVDNSGIVTLRVDNTTNIPNTTVGVINRPTVCLLCSLSSDFILDYCCVGQIKITSKDSFAVGSLLIMDLLHIPYGCSVCDPSVICLCCLPDSSYPLSGLARTMDNGRRLA